MLVEIDRATFHERAPSPPLATLIPIKGCIGMQPIPYQPDRLEGTEHTMLCLRLHHGAPRATWRVGRGSKEREDPVCTAS